MIVLSVWECFKVISEVEKLDFLDFDFLDFDSAFECLTQILKIFRYHHVYKIASSWVNRSRKKDFRRMARDFNELHLILGTSGGYFSISSA